VTNLIDIIARLDSLAWSHNKVSNIKEKAHIEDTVYKIINGLEGQHRMQFIKYYSAFKIYYRVKGECLEDRNASRYSGKQEEARQG
jgi:hypothetical protein